MKRARLGCWLAAVVLAAGCNKPVEWPTYTSSDGHYSIQMPGTPQEQTQTQSGVTNHMALLNQGGSDYMVSYADVPPGVKVDLDGAVKGAVAGAKGELIQSKEVTIEGQPGREFSFKVPDKGKGAARLFAVNNRLYQLLAIGTNIDPASDDVQKFLNSLKLEK